ncbi:MAG: phosphoadenylyl-sulfate reductase [Myxococcales bacterium]|nr:phosphoadenylyl-sulfate reductase [Myxococcales bacterium]
MKPSAQEIGAAQERLSGRPPQEVLAWALERFADTLAIASSFSIEDCVVIDMAAKLAPKVRVFALDTGRLPEETYQTAERVRDKYRLEIEWYFPAREAVETLERRKGLFSFMESLDNRHECCGLRKVEPLGRALGALDAWVTGLRREQSVTRGETPEVEFDEGHGGIAKLNPIISWSEAETRAYAKTNRVPLHPLHDRGYPSIGCAPCTRAVAAGDHPRAGRWWWEDPASKECGLHPVKDGGGQ